MGEEERDGGDREGWQPALGPHAGMQEMESGEEGAEGLQGATGGTGWAWLAKEHSLRLWTCLSAVVHKAGGCRQVSLGLLFSEISAFQTQTHSILKMSVFLFLWLKLF